ncbi:MAG: hypothetical protein ABSC04_20090 [Syntrophobacteraceae bacterium]|jgi:hypothetical protein
MECSQIRVILFENTDTEIPVEFREDVEAHLAVCRPCTMQFEALREQSHALKTLPKVEAPRDFLEQVRSRVEKPSILSRLKDGLSLLFAGKHFFRLAGAAATAVLVIAASQVIIREGGHKALVSPAPPSVKAPKSVEAPPPFEAQQSVKAPQSLQASPPSPWKDEKDFNRAAMPASEPHRPAGVETQSVVLTVKSHWDSARGKTHGGQFKVESFSPPGAGSTGTRALDQRSLKPDVSKGVSRPAKVSEDSPAPEAQEISSDVIRLIKRANGKVLSARPARDANQPDTLLAEMPATGYPSFLDQLRQLGEVEINGDKEFSLAPDSKVRVSVSFTTRD